MVINLIFKFSAADRTDRFGSGLAVSQLISNTNVPVDILLIFFCNSRENIDKDQIFQEWNIALT